MIQVAHGFRRPFPNLTARFAQDAKDAKKIILPNRVTVSRERLSDSLRFDKTLDPAGSHIHPKCKKIFTCVFAVQGLSFRFLSGPPSTVLCGSVKS